MELTPEDVFNGQFRAYTQMLVSLWLGYIADPTEIRLAAFRDAQSRLYLAQVYGLEGNFARATDLLHLQHFGQGVPVPAIPPTFLHGSTYLF